MSAELNTEKGQRKDPVCNMVVSSDSEYYYHYADKHYHFCSEHCLYKFREHPERYLDKETPPPHETGDESSTYTCPMHPEIQRQGPGSCPKCGMALEPMGVPVTATKTEYTCPMHPEVVQDHPGNCPKCGMALEPMGVPGTATKTEYTCPMHPEVVQDHPGNCPKCGMALEPVTVKVEEKNEELIDMSRRFWISVVLAVPVFLLAMVADLMPAWLPDGLSMQTVQWIEFVLAT